ncbi:S-layer homology domain-containing protein [Paenibacillus sp. 1_12]|uniref:S-layer homology domain-containing protein n=1 Tax=Paenibacillus sp. 1_12 TaxID=1566278 RepID=UPI0008EEF0B1|nr:S-layer homology domain-containing protein [Paenibacillus sp. 1_12]SFM55103.1 S-layer homology domain-containing protein [Paenibacillus sp. 1_12]
MALVNRSFGLNDKSEVIVRDVDSQRWDYEQVAIALHKVTRQKVAVMIAKLLKLDTSASVDLSKFKDAAQVPDWSKAMIGAIVAKGIYNGYDHGTLGYDKIMTRAEMIVILDRALSVTVTYVKAGVYGPETGHETIVGDVLLNASGVSLKKEMGNLTLKVYNQ